MLTIDLGPLAGAPWFLTRFSADLGQLAVPEWLARFLKPDAEIPPEVFLPAQEREELRQVVRDMLRRGGYKPTGRGKPSSEYLVRAASEEKLTSINLAVDACNAVSLHTALPISVVDAGRLRPPLRVALGRPGERYVFNPSGQEIALEELLCLFDAEGPCANAVKDSQRAKTTAETRETVSILWAPPERESYAKVVAGWYRGILERSGAVTEIAR